MKQYFFFTMIALGLVFSACKKDDEPDIKAGKLAGSNWVKEFKDKSSITENDYTVTIKFTSDKEGAYVRVGSWKVYSYSTKKWTSGRYNDNDKFTYVYSTELKQGVWTYSNKKQVIFSFSDDYQTLKAGSNYSRK
ncbi:MAG: hypothetical protein LBN27_08825 [Prevotellaceae bacterium]|jgi:hypothetical protein|nr:hypothetical protein [Prevotellaceae bacterium]